MEARKLASQVLAVCPFALIVGAVVSTRQPAPVRPVLQYSEAQNQRLIAYATVAKNAPSREAGSAEIRHGADVWIRVARIERLQALTPAFQEELGEDNPRSEILGKWRDLVQQMNRTMRLDEAQGNVEMEAEDGTRLIRLCGILKYSDFESVHLATVVTAHCIDHVGPVLAKVRPSVRNEFKTAAREAAPDNRRLADLCKLVRGNFDAYELRHAEFTNDVDDDTRQADSGAEDIAPFGLSLTTFDDAYAYAVKCQSLLDRSERLYVANG